VDLVEKCGKFIFEQLFRFFPKRKRLLKNRGREGKIIIDEY